VGAGVDRRRVHGVPVNPLQAARYRERLAVSGAKSDAADAHMLADMVRTDSHQLRPIAGDTVEVEAVKVVTRMHKALIWEGTRATQRLRHALREYFPAALEAFADLDATDTLELLARAPDPASLFGYVQVDQYTLQSPRWPNVFALGDAASLLTSKTGAAIRKQAPVVVANLLAAGGLACPPVSRWPPPVRAGSEAARRGRPAKWPARRPGGPPLKTYGKFSQGADKPGVLRRLMCDTRSPGDMRQRSVSAPCARRLRGASVLRGGRDWLWLSCRWSSNVWTRFVPFWLVRMSRKSLSASGCTGRQCIGG
jgi:Transposase